MKLVEETSSILRQNCNPVDFNNLGFDPEKLYAEMKPVMVSKNGLGLAAPQVGLLHRLFIMDNGSCCFNPEIVEVSQETDIRLEGCLSFPNLWLSIERPIWVAVRYFNEFGNFQEKKFDDIWARCFSHELDHLDGKLFLEKVSKLKLQMAKKKRQKLLKEEKS